MQIETIQTGDLFIRFSIANIERRSCRTMDAHAQQSRYIVIKKNKKILITIIIVIIVIIVDGISDCSTHKYSVHEFHHVCRFQKRTRRDN